MKLLVQEYLEKKTFGDLIRDHGVYASVSKSKHKFSLNYDQIEAKESDPLAQECRGLILAPADGKPLPCRIDLDGKRHYEDIGPGKTVVLAYPMKRFFNLGQGSAANIDFSDPNLSVLEKLDGCFTYNTFLTCWDGSIIKIGDVVKKKLTPTLIGLDNEGNIVPCQVLDWFDNGTKDNWLEIETTQKYRGKRRKWLITTNHSIFLNRDFSPALMAKVGDTLSSYEYRLSNNVIHMIESSLLGDATLSKNGSDFKYEEGHKTAHKELCDHIMHWLGESYSHTSNNISGFGTEMVRVSSKPNKDITNLRQRWYKGGVKKVPKDLSWMTNFSVAKWYMDDGSLGHNENQNDRALFATNGFTKKEVDNLGNRLSIMYGVDCTVYFSKGWCLRVNSGRHKEIDVMWSAIAPFIVPCMRYKLPEKYRGVPFENWEPGKVIKKVRQIKILKITKVPISKINNKKRFPNGRKGYDIKTSTGNYIANGVIVHNSLCIVYHDTFTQQWCVATRSVSEADLLMDNGLFTFRTLFEKAVQDTCKFSFGTFCAALDMNFTYCFELTTPYNRIVVNYPNNGITLLAVRDLITEQEVNFDHSIVQQLVGMVPFVQSYSPSTIDELVDWVSTLNPMEHEGVVVRDSNFNRIKVKNAAYVAASKIRDSLATSPRNCLELILLGKDDDAASFLPQEIQNNLISLKEQFVVWLKKQEELMQIIVAEAQAIAPDKKTFALTVQKYQPSIPAMLFNIYDGKSNSVKDFIEKNRKMGTWSDGFLDKILSCISS